MRPCGNGFVAEASLIESVPTYEVAWVGAAIAVQPWAKPAKIHLVQVKVSRHGNVAIIREALDARHGSYYFSLTAVAATSHACA